MPSRCNCGALAAYGCQCSGDDGDCLSITGSGTDDNPFIVEPILDPDGDNMLECNPSGFGAFLPPELQDPPTVSVYHTVPQTIVNNVQTVVFFNAELYDTDAMHDNATNNNRLTIRTAGVYVVTVSLTWEGHSGAERRIDLRKNGTEILVSDERPTTQSDQFAMNLTFQDRFAENDYMDVTVNQNSTVSLQIIVPPTAFARSPVFAATRIAVGLP